MKKHVWVCVAYDAIDYYTVCVRRLTRSKARLCLKHLREAGWKTKNPIKVSLP